MILTKGALHPCRTTAPVRSTLDHTKLDRRSLGLGSGRCARDRKSTRLNSSHGYISYAVFCLKKKKKHKSEPADSTRVDTRTVVRSRARKQTGSGQVRRVSRRQTFDVLMIMTTRA